MAGGKLVEIAAALVLIAGPLLLGLTGWARAWRTPADAGAELATAWTWKLTIMSALLYALAFNLIFFIQELFLVLPKAFTPGLRPTLFHNNHHWEGDNPLASLFQGTGALAVFLTAVVCALALRRAGGRSITLRLFLFWMAYSGFFMALPQVVIGAISPQSDVGMAMTWMELGAPTRTVAALFALAAIPLIALSLRSPLFGLAGYGDQLAGARARSAFVFRIATLPSLIAIPLIVLFRIPREWIEVLIVPTVVSLIGVAWIQAGAWNMTRTKSAGNTGPGTIAWPLGAVLLLLLIFQLLLRPGIRFY